MKGLGKFLGGVAQFLAIVMVVLLLLDYINGLYGFLPESIDKIWHYIMQYGTTLLVGLLALSAALKRSLILSIIVILLILAVLGFMFAKDIVVGYLPPAKPNTEGGEETAFMLAVLFA